MNSQKEIWDKIAPQWNVFRQKPKQEVLNFLEDKKGKILDLGCGSGRHLIPKKDSTFYEVDFSEQMIKFAREKAEKLRQEDKNKVNGFDNSVSHSGGRVGEGGGFRIGQQKLVKDFAEFFVADSSKLPFKDNFFDSAIYIAALHCIPSEKQRKDSLKELFRVLKKNSTALITVWSKNHIKLINHPKNATIVWKKQSEKLQRYYYLYDKDELEELLKKVGFKVLNYKEDNKSIEFVVEKN